MTDIYSLNDPSIINAFRGQKPRSKWNVSKSHDQRQMDGYTFDSEAEMHRYALLRLRERADEISLLMVHPQYVIVPAFMTVNGKHSAVKFTPDFSYREHRVDGSHWIVEDVKPKKKTKRGGYRPLVSADFTVRRKLFQQERPNVEFLIVCEVSRDSWQEFKF